MSSNGAFWPLGNLWMMKTLPEDHKPAKLGIKPYQDSPWARPPAPPRPPTAQAPAHQSAGVSPIHGA